MKLGIVGTSWITDSFLDGAFIDNNYELTAIYSRTKEKGLAFGAKYGIDNVYTDMEKMAKESGIEVVYIASPHSLHVPHGKIFASNKIHVILEKPMCLNSKELLELKEICDKNDVFCFEAIKTIFHPNIKLLKESLKEIGDIHFGSFNFMKGSSKYNAFKEGKVSTTLDAQYGGGALFDLGVYLIHHCCYLFGKPNSVASFVKKISDGVDGVINMVFMYDNFSINLAASKISTSQVENEIQGELGTITLDNITSLSKIMLFKDGEIKVISDINYENNMQFEAKEFMNIILKKDKIRCDQLFENSLDIVKIMEDIKGDMV